MKPSKYDELKELFDSDHKELSYLLESFEEAVGMMRLIDNSKLPLYTGESREWYWETKFRLIQYVMVHLEKKRLE